MYVVYRERKVKMVYLFLADGFEEIEALTQVDYLRRAGVEVVTVGVTGEYVTGTRDIVVKADITLEEAVYTDKVEMLVMPGGLGGTNAMMQNMCVTDMIKKAFDNGKYIAAICAAPTILAKMGLVKGKKCTCYPDMQNILAENGATVLDVSVVHDDNIITARAAGASEEFSFELIKVLKGEDVMRKVKKSICAR